MSVTLLTIGFLSAAAASLMLTGWVRRYALSRSIMDIPNSRSSHAIPTPRGGGIAIIIVFLVGLLLLAALAHLRLPLLAALLGAGSLVGAVGWVDDRAGLPSRVRLFFHFAAAIWIVLWIGGISELALFGSALNLGWVGGVLTVFYLVWMVNLYNFMDGIDGLAGIEAATVCLGALVLLGLVRPVGVADGWVLPVLMIGASGGFLYWNFPRAQIFMGDAGSGFLGIVLGGISLEWGIISPELFWGWLILLGSFIVDATVTLLRRASQGAKLDQAHRSHTYQKLAQRYRSHVRVSLAFAFVNLCWLLPVAALVVSGVLDGAPGMLIAYTPLAWIALRTGAGKAETVEKAVPPRSP